MTIRGAKNGGAFAFVLALTSALVLLRIAAACNSGTAATPVSNGSLNPELGDSAGLPPPCIQQRIPDGGPVRVTGTVTEARADAAAPAKPIANAMIAVEYGGLYLPWCDLASASPYYLFGALSDDAGRFEIDVKEGSLGFHSFADDYLYSRAALDTSAGKTVALTMEPLPTIDGGGRQPQPTIMDAKFDKTTVKAGELVTYSATLASWDTKKDPLSDENILVEATRSWCIELNPPAVGKKDDFADGLWKQTFPAPDKPGTYTYWFSATTSQCVTSKLVSSTLTVVP